MAMANFQIGHSALFPDGAELFANGKSGDEKLVLRQDPGTIDPVGLWTGKQFLEVVSGPLR
jgi:hypothetical protein